MRAKLMVLFLLTSVSALAGVNLWSTNGPGGANIAGLHVDPATPEVAFVETPVGLYRTSDGGDSWQPIGDGLAEDAAMIVASGTTTTLYAWSGNVVFASTDKGDHWQRRGPFPNTTITSMAFEAASGNLYAVTSAGIFISGDDGVTWNAATLPDANPNFSHVTISSTAVYILRQTAVPPYFSLIRSKDHGLSWSTVTASPKTDYVEAVYADPRQQTIYTVQPAGLMVSHDDGQTWKRLSAPRGNIEGAVVRDDEFYVATTSGVFVLNRTSSSFKQVAAGAAVASVEVASSDPLRIYALPPTDPFGVIRWVAGESAWRSVNTGLPGPVATGIALADSQPEIAYAATQNGMFRTQDGGQQWTKIGSAIYSSSIAVSPTDPRTVFAASGGVMKTSDAGNTWKKVAAAPNASQVVMSPSDPKTLYAVLSTALMKSSDGGDSWAALSGVPPYSSFYYYQTYTWFAAGALAVDPRDSAKVVLSESGIYATDDGGAHWNNIAGSSGEPRANAIAIDDASRVFISSIRGGVLHRSGDVTWESAGLIDKTVSALAAAGTSLYAGTTDGHVYRSDNAGRTWIGFDDGLSRGTVFRITIDLSGTHLYAATAAGVYGYEIVEQSIAPERVADDPNIVGSAVEKSGLVFPVAGSISGAAASFSTEMTLRNSADSPQTLLIAWLPQGRGGEASFHLTLPPGTLKIDDFGAHFGVSGIGTIVVVPIDTGASVSGSLRIWTHPSDGRAPLAQTIDAVPSADLAPHAHAIVNGIAQDSAARINTGIVNLSNASHQFIIQINGQRGSGQVTLDVPPLSLLQVAMPDGDFGAVTVDAFADDSNTRWIFYASAVDRMTGQASTVIGQPGQ